MRAALILTLCLFSCNNTFFSSKKQNNNIIISLQKTACFGTCPEYKLDIYENGKVLYLGTRHVEHIGEKQVFIDFMEIQSILKYAKKNNFFRMKNEYSEPISDLPTTYIRIKGKKIKDYSGAPNELKELVKIIENKVFKRIIK